MSVSPLPVVCALIERDGRVLVARRPWHKALGGCWEFPGGKVEFAELPVEALRRELREELGVEIESLRPLPARRYDYPEVAIELIPYVARLAPGSPEPEAREHVALEWMEPWRLGELALAPADLPVLADYLERLAGSPAACSSHQAP